ncbi:response regulator [Clostridium cochlearium]|uniref:Stage 0 sporulation protein A homolog n=2 Tax=Clostridium cochlearium TaxID=1494 RepID=A0A2X2W9T2_CLOCO|nr:response regulator [Clostridium cochlearium]SQB36237.1 two-component sensor histidine kinase [Clostridium cochlearium]
MKEKILIVEDDEEIALCIKEYIEKTGYEVLWASTGKEGYEEFKEENFSLLMIDIMMPEMDGLILCKNIRLTSDVPILIISAKNEDGDKVRGLNIGADDYITKPFSLVELKARVESHLRRYRRYHGIENNEHILKFKKGLVIYKEGKYVNERLFNYATKKLNIIDEKNKDIMKIELYDKNGGRIYSLNNEEEYFFPLDKKQLYSNLYKIIHGFRADTLKKPVFKDGDLIGFYEITIMRSNIIKGVNDATIKAIIIFTLVFITVLLCMIKFMNKKFNNPIQMLIKAMKAFPLGEESSIDYKANDEIGELINHFNYMKGEIIEKNNEIEKEQKSKEYMIAAISHDLKTPLTSIRAYAELMNVQEEKNNKYVKGILNKCDYMTNMLQDLLMYTILSSNYNMDFVDVEGEEFFEMLFSGYEELCKKNNINYLSEIKVNRNYKVDVKQMIRLVDNLVANAIRHTEKGKHIYIGAFSSQYELPNWVQGDDREKINSFRKSNTVIIVKNEGEEIPKEDIKRIIEPFYKGDRARNIDRKKLGTGLEKGGTGLGLSIVKLIIEKHGGEINILSSKDRGTLMVCVLKEERNEFL